MIPLSDSARFSCVFMFQFIVIILFYLSYTQVAVHRQTPPPLPDADILPTVTVAVLKRYDTSRMVLSLVVREQLSRAIAHLYDMTMFATDSSWNASIVLPVMNGDQSRVVGIPSSNTYPLSAIYNISAWQQMYKKLNICLPLTDFEDFMKYTDRNNICYLYMVPARAVALHQNHSIDPIFEKCSSSNKVDRALRSFHTAIDSLNVEAIKRNLPGFELSNAHCFMGHVGHQHMQPQDFITACGLNNVKKFTVIFNTWAGIVFKPRPGVAHIEKRVVVSLKEYEIRQTNWLLPPYSNDVEGITIKYLKNLTKGVKFIGVHIRAEKIWIRNSKDKDSNFTEKSEQHIRKCIILAQKIFEAQHFNTILFFGDHMVKKYGHVLSELGVSMSHFDSSKYNAIQNNGLIGQIEQNVLSYAERLVACGGGSFQSSVIERFKKRKPKGSVDHV